MIFMSKEIIEITISTLTSDVWLPKQLAVRSYRFLLHFLFWCWTLTPWFPQRKIISWNAVIDWLRSLRKPFFYEEFILPLSNSLNVVQRSFHCWISCVFRYKWDQVCAFLFKWVAKFFYNRNQRLNMTYEACLASPGLLMMWCASLVGVVLLYCNLKLFYHFCQLRSGHHPS